MGRKSLEVSVEPKVLKWARESVGIDSKNVAERLKLSEDIVSKWELGKKKPTLIQLEELAKIYKRPLAAFFLPEPPKEPPSPKDFRTLPLDRREPLSAETRLAIRRARRLQSLAADLAESINQEISIRVGRAKLSDNPEILAIKVRQQLGIKIETQFSWKSEIEAFNEWKKVIEKQGILILQVGMPLKEARGFSLTKGKFPTIVLNLRDLINGKTFSLFHEYAHLLLNDGGICDMEFINNFYYEAKSIEKFCNHFAGAVLVPKDALLNHELINLKKPSLPLYDEVLKELANSFKVSQEVILRRLVILGCSTLDFYKRKREEWELKAKEKQRRGGRSNPAKKCIQQNGIPFVSLVLEAHREKKITYSDVADYLGIRLKHLPKVEQLIRDKV